MVNSEQGMQNSEVSHTVPTGIADRVVLALRPASSWVVRDASAHRAEPGRQVGLSV